MFYSPLGPMSLIHLLLCQNIVSLTLIINHINIYFTTTSKLNRFML